MDEEKNNTTYACPECGLHYRDEGTAKKCEAWCKEHGTRSADISVLSLEFEGPMTPAEAGGQYLMAKCAELETNWKRALADYANLQKEVARERAEMGQYATLRAVERLLPVFDNFNVAVSHIPKSDDKAVVSWSVGIGFIQKQIEDALKDLGLVPIKTVGEKFDAARHEAIGEEDEGKGHGTVLKEVQTGYEINGKVVRPAKVIVNK